jgi:CCR4-NOT transcription complex subunit 6
MHVRVLSFRLSVNKMSIDFNLQEVELREYVTFFQPKLAQHGYTGVFALKSRARTKSSDEQLDVDGCAIFYKSNK